MARLNIDAAHTLVGFVAKHLGVTSVRGNFNKFDGWIEGDPDNLAEASGEVNVDVTSINTNVDQRDTHLKSADFFEAETYPNITYRFKGIEKTGDETYRINGDLTIRSVTKTIPLDVTYWGEAPDPFGGKRRVGVTATGQLNRKDFGLTWDGLAGTIPLVSNAIRLEIEAELVEPAAATQAT